MIARGDICLARAVVSVRSAGVVAVAAPAVAPALVQGRPIAAVRYSAGVMGRDGKEGPQGLPGTSSGLSTYTAAALVSGDKAVMFSGAGMVVAADPTAPGYVYAGIALNAAQVGGAVQVQSEGDVQASFWSWILPASGQAVPIFTAPGGNLTQQPPTIGRLHLIGWAVDAHTIHLVSSPPRTFL